MDLTERIYQIIEKKHLKQCAIAEAAGFTPRVFNDLLRKRKAIKPEYIPAICEVLGVTPNELFGFENNDDQQAG